MLLTLLFQTPSAAAHIPSDSHPRLLTRNLGPQRQTNLDEWSLPGSVNTPKATSTQEAAKPSTASVSGHKHQVHCILPLEDPNRVIIDGEDDEDELSGLIGEGEGDEDDGGDDNMDDGEGSQNQAHCPLPPSVHDVYERNIEFLKQTKGLQS